MTTTIDHYAWWREAMKGAPGPISADHPQCGRYKMRRAKDGPWLPVAIYQNAGEIKAAVGKDHIDPLHVWTYCAKNPIDEDAYRFAIKNGRFPDEPETLQQRSNMPADPFEALKVEIEDRAAQAEAWLNAHPDITSQQECDLARNMQAQLLKLGKQADKDRETQKAPHLEACRVVDTRFKPLTTIAKDMADRLRGAFERFMRADEARQRAEAQKRFDAERAAAEAERKRIEAEQAKKMRDDPIAALTEAPPEMPPLPLTPEPIKVQAGGGFGRKAGLKTKRRAQIVDIDAVFHHFKGRQEIHDLLEKLANSSLRAGIEVPGTKTVEERVAA